MKLYNLYNELRGSLQGLYSEGEARAIAMSALEVGALDIALRGGDEVAWSADDVAAFELLKSRLMAGEPVQYVLGCQEFYGRRFGVSPAVLIPRGETEQLVGMVVEWCVAAAVVEGRGMPLRVLDIGTGSGAIAVSVALEVGLAFEVVGWDVSEAALEVAGRNACVLGVENVNFERMDILDCDYSGEQFDVVVSNPPYVTPEQKQAMQRNVLDYEPELALFVEQHDPLLFYRTITDFCVTNLRVGGALFFEINELYGSECEQLLRDRGFSYVRTVRDIHEKDRIVCGTK